MLELSIKGEGDTLVFLHGFCEDKRIWSDMVEQLANTYRCISIDLPGFGDNGPLGMKYSVAQMAKQVINTIKEKTMAPYLLIGHSLGGYVLMEMVKLAGDQLKGACLFHSTAKADSPEKAQSRKKAIDFVQEHGMEPFLTPFFTSLFYKGHQLNFVQEIDRLLLRAKSITKQTFIYVMEAMAERKDNTSVLEGSPIPWLFIVGKEDQSIPYSSISDLFDLPKSSEVLLLEECGHMGMFEYPKACMNKINEFAQDVFSSSEI